MKKLLITAIVLLVIAIALTAYAADYDKQTVALLGMLSGLFSGVFFRETHYFK